MISGRDALRAFEHQGWVFRRQTGSHMILTKAGSIVSLSIPDHRELTPDTLRKPFDSPVLTSMNFERR